MTKSTPPPLTESQREVMEIFWKHGEATVSEVREYLASLGRHVARNTVQTTIVRLEAKGWAKHRECGRTFVYSAAQTKTRSLGVKVAQMVDRFFAGSPEDMVTALIEYRGLTEAEATRITAMIDEAAAKTKESSPKKTKSKSTQKRGR
ncbi:MAG: BlaI/MecI/CopY family transcriptional regulator [bacterium]|nr:BlaI/MecI/CopY family transcriptional regulator [bacterium]